MTPKLELLKSVVRAGLDESQALDLLQLDHGVVSDLCTGLSQVADDDCPRAIEVLDSWSKKK